MTPDPSLKHNSGIKPFSFDNTEIAFRNKTNKDLNQAYWLFKIIGNGFLMKAGPGFINLGLKMGLPIYTLIRNTVFKQFCGGESIAECEPTIELLAKGGVGTILDYSVEGRNNEKSFSKTTEEIIQTIRRAKGDSRIPLTVFKISGIARTALLYKLNNGGEPTDAERVEFFKIKGRVNHICKTASDLDVPVMMDAEESWIQNVVDDLALDMMRLYNREKAIVYNTYQLYRKDKLPSLKADVYLAETDGFVLGAKLVRGAYLEKERERALKRDYESPIHEDKDATDLDFNEALNFCTAHLKNVAFVAGTHNEKSCFLLTQLMAEKGIPVNHPHVYFAQLLGMSDNLSFNLANAGYNVAKYVPYGPVKDVLPYLFRRADENRAIAGQTGRELSLIVKEKKRRKRS